MDHLLISLAEARRLSHFSGKIAAFKSSPELVEFCLSRGRIVEGVHPTELHSELYPRYFAFLVNITLKSVEGHLDLRLIDELGERPGFRRSFKVLWEHGVIGDIRNKALLDSETEMTLKERPSTSLTIHELYEVAVVRLNFSGSEQAFKKQVQRLYGSFAEYCIEKGYDINTTKWESDENALRVARKLGSRGEIEKRSRSLAKYLTERKLWELVVNENPARSAAKMSK